MRAFLADLRRRGVVRVAVVYAVVAWLMIQFSATVFPMLGLPDWSPTLVLALLGVGFPIAIALTWAYDVTPDGVVRTDALKTPARAPAPARARQLESDGADSLEEEEEAAAHVHARPHARGRALAPADSPAPGDSPRSLAVLPFADLSRERDQEYLGDGIAEEILNVLACVEDLRVAARTSAFAFKGRNLDVREIGRQLGVDAVLEGSVRTAGNQLRVTAQLIGVQDGYHIWSRRFDRDLSDVFAVQDEIAAEIAAALQVAKPIVEVAARNGTEHIQAYDAYLKGRQFFHRKTGRSLRIAARFFEEALAIDPTYAPAHAGIADTCSLLYSYWAPTEENRRCADESSQRALEYGPSVAEAHVSRGLALSLQKRYDEAAVEFEAAIALNPRLYEAWYFYGRSAFAAGQPERAAERFQRAGEIQPESYDNWGLLSNALNALGRTTEGRAASARVIEAAEDALRLNPDDVRALYFGSGALFQVGERERGIEWSERAAAMDPDDPTVHYNLACNFSIAKLPDRALDHLDRAVDLGYGAVEWMQNDSDLDAVRGHPRYPALLERMRTLQASGGT